MSHILLYLDESGDLGFDLSKKGTSPYFVLTILLCEGQVVHKALKKAVSRTIKNKLSTKVRKKAEHELKGNKLNFADKLYLWGKLPVDGWELYSLVLHKKKIATKIHNKQESKDLYNYLTRALLSKIPFNKNIQAVNLIVDQCKNPQERYEFDQYLKSHFEELLYPKTKLNIKHERSHQSLGIQLVDLFCWGIARKYIFNDYEWYDFYKDKILIELIIK